MEGTCESGDPQVKGSGMLEKGNRLSGVLIWVPAHPVCLRLTSCEASHFSSLSTLCRVDASIIITPEMIYAKPQALDVSADCRPGVVKIFHLYVLG